MITTGTPTKIMAEPEQSVVVIHMSTVNTIMPKHNTIMSKHNMSTIVIMTEHTLLKNMSKFQFTLTESKKLKDRYTEMSTTKLKESWKYQLK